VWVVRAIFSLGQRSPALTVTSCWVPTAPTAHGGFETRPAGDEIHRQKRGSHMRSIKGWFVMSKRNKKSYVDVSVAAELLVELKQKQNDAPGGAMEKYGRFKNWLRYANLKGWQEQKWHWGYVNYCGQEWRCTCGLVIPMGAKHEVSGLEHLELDAAHRARGHRSLPDFGEQVVAFIYDYKWMEELGVYYYDAFCQVCGDSVKERPGKDADLFAQIHNISCL